MWLPRESEKRAGNGLVAVAIDKDRGSQNAIKYAVDHLLVKGQTVLLLHVKVLPPSVVPSPRSDSDSNPGKEMDPQTKDFFLPFRCLCTRKEMKCKEVVLEDNDVAKVLTDYVARNVIDHLVVGAPAKSGFLRFKTTDVAANVCKIAPDFCHVYVVAKGDKLSSMRSATRPPPPTSSLRAQLLNQMVPKPDQTNHRVPQANSLKGPVKPPVEQQPLTPTDSEPDFFMSPFSRGRGDNGRSYGEFSMPDSDISFVSNSTGRHSVDRLFPAFYGSPENVNGRLSNTSDMDFDVASLPRKSMESYYYRSEFSSSSIGQDADRLSVSSSSNIEDAEAEMRRLRMELEQTMKMYSSACKEALSAKQKASELQRWKMEEQKKFEEARMAEKAAMAIAEREKAKSQAAIEAAEAARRIAELEAQKRMTAEMKALKEAEEKKKVMDRLSRAGMRCRKYTIEEIEAATNQFAQSNKVGEGGYGPVYKGYLDHTPVAIKVLRPDAAQGRSQFLQEVEILSSIRHPNMVLLLGACPEYGCLVYEYMSNGSLEDRLLRRGGTHPISWPIRFKIAAEIGTSLLFLHQTKPEPLVHRDLKPGNILLDRNYVSKIADVGLARLVPPAVADKVTQYRMTSTAGTFCYIDPEYQQTGMLGVKSDIYSLGIIFLQLLTARSPMGLTHHVERAIREGTMESMLDPTVPDWPVEEALKFAELALQCSQLRRRDRPDLGKVILPELNKLRALAEDAMQQCPGYNLSSHSQSQSHSHSQSHSQSQSRSQSQVSLHLETMSNTSAKSIEG